MRTIKYDDPKRVFGLFFSKILILQFTTCFALVNSASTIPSVNTSSSPLSFYGKKSLPEIITNRVIQNGIRVINSSDIGITFQFSTVNQIIDLISLGDNKTVFHQIRLPGCQRIMAKPGYPDLPQSEVMIGIPQTGNVILSVKPGSAKHFHNIDLAPVPKQTWDSATYEKAIVYQQNRPLPGPLVEIKDIGLWRDVRIAKILLSPAQYNPVTQELEIFETLVVSVQFTEKPIKESEITSSIFDPIYGKILLNGNIAKDWKSRSNVIKPTKARNFFQFSDNWLKVKVESTGVYKITYDDLKKSGFSQDRLRAIKPNSFRLFNIGRWTTNEQYPDSMIENPIYVYGAADNSFDPQDYILFFGVSVSDWDSTHQVYRTNYFTNYNYYWLTFGGPNGRRITLINNSSGSNPLRIEKARSKIHFEEDVLCPARSGLLWLWYQIAKSATTPSATLEIPFHLPNVDSLFKFTFAFYQPASNLSAHYEIYLNQTLIDTGLINTAYSSPYILTLESLPLVTADENIVKIQLTGTTEMQLYLDYFEVEYRQQLNLRKHKLDFSLDSLVGNVELNLKGVRQAPFIFDVTDKAEPKWLVDFVLNGDSLKFQLNFPNPAKRFYHITDLTKLLKPVSIEPRQPGRLKTENDPADYYIVTPDELFDAARLIARYRTNNIAGLAQARARAVKLSDIYDEYSFGLEEPGAIREFFRSKQPDYGLLLGDATYDYRNNLGFTDFPVLPAYEQGFDFDPDVYSEVAYAQDAYYAQFNSGPPDMILGRATSRTSEAVRKFYEKVRDYEAKPYGFWNSRLLLLADDDLKGLDKQGNILPDNIRVSEHVEPCEMVADIYLNRLEPVKVYLTEFPLAPGQEYAKPLARASFIRALNQGALILNYFGHGAGWQLAHEKAFYVEEDVVKVNNGRRNPFAFFGSCGVGRFEDTKFQSIAEELVRKEDGCIGTVGATKGTGPFSNRSFAGDMFGLLADTNQMSTTIGQAFFAAWHNDPKYHFFGDPALVLNLPESNNPIKISPDTFKLGATCAISDSLSSLSYPVNYYLMAYGPKWLRTYVSSFSYHGTINYVLPGFELFRGLGQITQPRIEMDFIIPRGQSPYMRGDAYQQIQNSARVYLGISPGPNFLPFIKDSIPMSFDTTPRSDTSGPVVNLYADKQMLKNGSKVPAQFVLSGTIYDPSGILILPNTVSGCSLNFYDPETGKPIGLGQYFIYSNNSYIQGQFTYPNPVTLTENTDTLVLIAYDCQLNRTEKRVEVSRAEEGLKISNALVYPNPVKTNTYFTFTLSKDALVRINIFTINGRPVKNLPERICSIGYNQIPWDGRDDTGVLPANGVYLYQIKARFWEGRNQEQTSTVTDKLLILR